MAVSCKTLALGSVALLTAACTQTPPPAAVSRFLEPEPQVVRAEGPPNAPQGTCWGRDVTPAVIETVTDRVMLQPAEIDSNGNVRRPAVFKTETAKRIVEEREEIWFETPCPDVLTPGFIANLQRALQARGHYRGTISGEMDGATRRAVRSYQRAEGLDSPILSLAAARKMGLVAVDRAALEDARR